MASLQLSPQNFRNGATNAATIRTAIAGHPIHQPLSTDLGHAGVTAAVTAFRDAWINELRLRKKAASQATLFLSHAATDTERVDTLLANAAARIGSKR